VFQYKTAAFDVTRRVVVTHWVAMLYSFLWDAFGYSKLSLKIKLETELESCMIKLPLSAFGSTINDKTFGFQLFHAATFLSFQLSAFHIRNSSVFGF